MSLSFWGKRNNNNKKETYKIMKDKHDQKHASRHGYTYILQVYMCLRHISVCQQMQIQNICVHFTHTYCEGYMHMHAPLVFTLYVKYLQFLIFIQCTKMFHELKNSLQKETYQTMYKSSFKFNWNATFGLSKIFMHTIKLSMQIKETHSRKRLKYTMYTN